MSRTITIDVPDAIFENYKNAKEIERSIYEDVIIREYQKGNLSIRDAAKILGVTYEGFIEWLGERNVPFISASREELEKDYEEFERFMKKSKE